MRVLESRTSAPGEPFASESPGLRTPRGLLRGISCMRFHPSKRCKPAVAWHDGGRAGIDYTR